MVASTDGQDTRVNTFQIGHRTGDHKGPPQRILTPLAPTIRRIGPQSSCIVGAGEDVDVGHGPTPVGRDKSGPNAPYTII